MRLFEALLIVLAGQLALAVAVMGAHRPRWSELLPLVLIALLAAHLAVEGYRWQMVPVYAAVAGMCGFGVARFVAGTAGNRGKLMSRLLGILAFVMLMAGAGAVIFLP